MTAGPYRSIHSRPTTKVHPCTHTYKDTCMQGNKQMEMVTRILI
uniref:Uncharacterized protein n=1 Tax=Arundo donax TaxID=35708 RepID=A0A0A9T7Y0_ARUDO